MNNTSIYKDIALRTKGDIYLGVVGPVRTGKSTFIKRFMNQLVLPKIDAEFERERATDELPQSSSGRTIMTTEPKFVPENAVKINVDENSNFNVRLIDCVGYIVPSALGYIEEDKPRMVMTPWFEEPVPFNMAAEIGTKKVITEHSTIGLVITTDGSISDIPRSEYAEAEERVINELVAIEKPFAVLLNCTYPNSEEAQNLVNELKEKYKVPVIAVNCLELNDSDIRSILGEILYEFPIKEIFLDYPKWVNGLENGHHLKNAIFNCIKNGITSVKKIREISDFLLSFKENENVDFIGIDDIDLGKGKICIKITLNPALLYQIIKELSGLEINNEHELIKNITHLAKTNREFARFKNALDEVEATGYGIVMPSIDELTLEEPEIMKQGGRYGVRLKASAPSIHMMKANITTEVSPIVGSEKQSEDLVMYLLSEFEENPVKIWDSNIFGKSLHELVNEGLHTKLARMPADARMRVQETIERVINEGCNGLVCIIL